jgi:predicted transcriptional regulator
MYEEGRSVKEIAKAMGTAPSEVNALLAKTDDTQTVQVARQEKHVRDLRRVRALADSMDEKANAFGEMDKVIRISKLSSDRVLLAEGKTTENIGVEGSVGMPFNVVFTKTYESPAEPESS